MASPEATPAPPTPLPTAEATPSATPSPPVSGLPAGWHPELRCADEHTDCRLHVIDAAGREVKGWPVEVGDCSPDGVAVTERGVIHVACAAGSRAVVRAFDLAGRTLPGWPVKLKGDVGMAPLKVAADGTVFVAIADPEGSSFAIHALGPDGVALAGWPRKLPGEQQGFTMAPDETVVGWWYEPRELDPDEEGGLACGFDAALTWYTRFRSNGRTVSGWPVSSIGAASAPVVTKDGSLFYTSATGKVWGHDQKGGRIDGWPYRLPESGVAPELRPDGRLVFILGGYQADEGPSTDSEVIVLTPAGRVAAGWPYRVSGALDAPPQGMCNDCCGPSVLPHAIADDSTLYLAPWTRDQAEVVAVAADGTVVDGWPHRLPAGWRVADLAIDPTGNLDVGLAECPPQNDPDCYGDVTRRITLTPTGDLAP